MKSYSFLTKIVVLCLSMTQSQKSLANVCLFCGEGLQNPSMCRFCGFKFCDEHKSTDGHQCIKTRYSEYVRKKPGQNPNISQGNFRVVCEVCGFNTSKGVPIEYAGEELIQHTQIVGCSGNVFLEEVKDTVTHIPIDSVSSEEKENDVSSKKIPEPSSNTTYQPSIIDQIVKLASLKEKGMISEQEFLFIKNQLIQKLK